MRAHRIILTTRSAVFRALLNAPMREGAEGVVTLEDVRAPVFRALLHFIYTDALPEVSHLLCGCLSKRVEGPCDPRVRAAEIWLSRFMGCMHTCRGSFYILIHIPPLGLVGEQELEGTSLGVAMAQHLLVAADRFALARLRRTCERRLCETVEVSPDLDLLSAFHDAILASHVSLPRLCLHVSPCLTVLQWQEWLLS